MFLLFRRDSEIITGSQYNGFHSFFSYPLGCVKEIANTALSYYLVSRKVNTLNGNRKNCGGFGAVARLFVSATRRKNRKNEVMV